MSNTSISPIYEINTAVYLSKLSKNGRLLKLDQIPDSEIRRIADLGFKSVWLMGIWQRSPIARTIALSNAGLMAEVGSVLPDFNAKDLIGSAYAIKNYMVNQQFGGETALAKLRNRLNDFKISLILDFVPNHVAADHPWLKSNHDYFIYGKSNDLKNNPEEFINLNGDIYAFGRDPTYPPWNDVVQLNAFSTSYREQSITTLLEIAKMCDGVRCDMAMLLLNQIFESTWGVKAGTMPEIEYWQKVINQVKLNFPDFQFIAEAYWDTQSELLNLGFDYCYDKDLSDYLAEGSAKAVYKHLIKTMPIRDQLLTFIENHDELRSASIFNYPKLFAAATVITMLPGATLIYDGQIEGNKTRVPVHLARGLAEQTDVLIQHFYQQLFEIVRNWQVEESEMQIVDCNKSSVLAWRLVNQNFNHLVAVNYDGSKNTALIKPSSDYNFDHQKELIDLFDPNFKPVFQEDKQIMIEFKPWQIRLINLD